MNTQHLKLNEVMKVRSDKPRSSQIVCAKVFVNNWGGKPLVRSLLPLFASKCKGAFDRKKVSEKEALHLG